MPGLGVNRNNPAYEKEPTDMTDKTMVLKQLDFMAGCKYDRYNREPMQGAKVLKADTERLLTEVDWVEGDVDTDAMQIELQAHFDNYFGLSHMEEMVRILIIEPIQEWVNRPVRN